MPRQYGKKIRLAARLQAPPAMSMTSLLDIMTILLVFMLKNYATGALRVTPSDDLELTASTEIDSGHGLHTTLAITRRHILVDDMPVVAVKDGRVPTAAKRDGKDGYLIDPLLDRLIMQRSDHERAANALAKKAEKTNKPIALRPPSKRLIVMADKNTDYRLLSEVLYTAGQAQFSEYEFVVMKP